jgi:hypothetical protein
VEGWVGRSQRVLEGVTVKPSMEFVDLAVYVKERNCRRATEEENVKVEEEEVRKKAVKVEDR